MILLSCVCAAKYLVCQLAIRLPPVCQTPVAAPIATFVETPGAAPIATPIMMIVVLEHFPILILKGHRFSYEYISLIASIVEEQLISVFFCLLGVVYYVISTFGFSKLLSFSLPLASNISIFNFCNFTCLHFQINL